MSSWSGFQRLRVLPFDSQWNFTSILMSGFFSNFFKNIMSYSDLRSTWNVKSTCSIKKSWPKISSRNNVCTLLKSCQLVEGCIVVAPMQFGFAQLLIDQKLQCERHQNSWKSMKFPYINHIRIFLSIFKRRQDPSRSEAVTLYLLGVEWSQTAWE